jgi:beta-lactam-binding protein with PASTA domain
MLLNFEHLEFNFKNCSGKGNCFPSFQNKSVLLSLLCIKIMINFFRFFFSKLFLKQLLWAGLLLVLLVGISFYGLNKFTQHRENIQVPDLEALDIQTIASVLDQYELRFEVLDSTKFNALYPAFSVIEQFPLAGSDVKKGRKIYLTINPSGFRKLSVPDVIQITKRNAETKLTAVGFQLGKITYRNNIGKDMVLQIRYQGKAIKPGTILPKTSKIDLVLGNGKR